VPSRGDRGGQVAAGTALVWFRRDLRLSDHPALSEAVARFDRVVPLFVWDPVLTRAAGTNRVTFLAGCVEQLDRSLDGQLVVRSGPPERMLVAAAAEAEADEVLVTADYGPYGSRRDESVGRALESRGVPLRAVDSPYAVAPGTVLTGGGTPFQVFTPFSRAWRSQRRDSPRRRPSLSSVTRAGLSSSVPPVPEPGPAALPAPGEDAAHRRLDAFLRSDAGDYRKERDRPDLDTTSRLSPYLRFGCLHPRQVLSRLEPGRPGHDTFETELCWREFYADVLHHRPDAARRSYREEFRRIPVDSGADADDRFQAWTRGRTGYPIVDAGMRQLVAEGWMHNRVRMIVASFLVKDLHLDWSRGARFFMEHLVDGDLASNQLNWQWVAGSGTDAAPYFRVFNPVTQGQKFDPSGAYIRRWVAELAGCPADVVHQPWASSSSGAPDGYPPPIVDHAEERAEALARYGRIRNI
jgi:deoxyribodipyrimidine photo-lyase